MLWYLPCQQGLAERIEPMRLILETGMKQREWLFLARRFVTSGDSAQLGWGVRHRSLDEPQKDAIGDLFKDGV